MRDSCVWPRLGGAVLLANAALLAACASSPTTVRRAPNIVLVLADDLGIGDIGAFHPESKVPTPALDRLASEGLRCTDVHSPSSVCTPTRYGVLCGRYAWRSSLKSGVLNGWSPLLIEPSRPTIASVLRGAGYRTAGFGKWHLGLGDADRTDYAQPLRPGPVDLGFERYRGIPASLDFPPYVWVHDDRVESLPTNEVAASGHRRQGGSGFWRAGPAAPDFEFEAVLPTIADDAVEWLHERAGEPEPFFLYVPLSAPHTPWLPSEPWQGSSGAGYYGDFVAMVDASVGRIVQAVDDLGLAGDTLIVVTSDNGSHWPDADIATYGHDANAGYRGQKADIFEGGHRVPFLVRWPGRVPAGEVRSELGCLTDLFRSFATLAGAAVPPGAAEDSVDLSPLWLGTEGAVGRTQVVHHSLSGLFALRSGSWKLVLGLGSGGFTPPRRVEPEPGEAPGRLFDLAADPYETRDLYAERPDIVERLSRELTDLRGE